MRTPMQLMMAPASAQNPCAVVVLASDGTMWTLEAEMSGRKYWARLPSLPPAGEGSSS